MTTALIETEGNSAIANEEVGLTLALLYSMAMRECDPTEAMEMRDINLALICEFGETMALLMEAEERPLEIDQTTVKRSRIRVKRILKDFHLPLSRHDGERLIRKLNDAERVLSDTSVGDKSLQDALSSVGLAAHTWHTVLYKELKAEESYLVEEKGGVPASTLLRNVEKVLPSNVLNKLSSQVIDDIRQACRCLALGCNTASGFHMMRAMEAVIHAYYIKLCSPASFDPLNGWAAYLDQLRKCCKTDKGRQTLELIQRIKNVTRNPIIHRDVMLTADEALAMFGMAQTAIGFMAEEL